MCCRLPWSSLVTSSQSRRVINWALWYAYSPFYVASLLVGWYVERDDATDKHNLGLIHRGNVRDSRAEKRRYSWVGRRGKVRTSSGVDDFRPACHWCYFPLYVPSSLGQSWRETDDYIVAIRQCVLASLSNLSVVLPILLSFSPIFLASFVFLMWNQGIVLGMSDPVDCFNGDRGQEQSHCGHQPAPNVLLCNVHRGVWHPHGL